MKIDILTLFPEMFSSLNQSIIGRAIDAGVLEINVHDIRSFTLDKHGKCDDTPYGGGAGMVMTAQPVISATRHVDPDGKAARVYMSPRGRLLSTPVAKEYSGAEHVVVLCGHYEGIDERALTICNYTEVSIGDYILTGGELPAMIFVDCIARFVPGVLGSELSAETDSFSDGLLEYPQYTKPAVVEGLEVPEVLLSGHHANVEKWRKEQSLLVTKKNRPDLLKNDN